MLLVQCASGAIRIDIARLRRITLRLPPCPIQGLNEVTPVSEPGTQLGSRRNGFSRPDSLLTRVLILGFLAASRRALPLLSRTPNSRQINLVIEQIL